MKKLLVLSMAIIISSVGLYAFTNNAEGAYYSRDGLTRRLARPTYSFAPSEEFNISANASCSADDSIITADVKISFTVLDNARFYYLYRNGVLVATVDILRKSINERGSYVDTIYVPSNEGMHGLYFGYHMEAVDVDWNVIDTSNSLRITIPDVGICAVN